MDAKRFFLATIAGGVVLYVTGFLVYGVALADFMRSHTAPGVMKDMPDMVPLITGQLVMGAFLTLILANWDGAQNMKKAANVGAVLGLLLGLGISSVLYATMNLMEVAAIPIDTIVTSVRFGLAGGAIGAVLGRG